MDSSFKTFCSAVGGGSPPLVSVALGLTSWCPEVSDLLDPTTLVSGGSDSGGSGLVTGGSWGCSLVPGFFFSRLVFCSTSATCCKNSSSSLLWRKPYLVCGQKKEWRGEKEGKDGEGRRKEGKKVR